MANHPAAMGVKMDFDEWFLREFGHLPGTCRQIQLMKQAFEFGRVRNHVVDVPAYVEIGAFPVWLQQTFPWQREPVPWQSVYFLAMTAGYDIGAFR